EHRASRKHALTGIDAPRGKRPSRRFDSPAAQIDFVLEELRAPVGFEAPVAKNERPCDKARKTLCEKKERIERKKPHERAEAPFRELAQRHYRSPRAASKKNSSG